MSDWATIFVDDAARRMWDVLVVGAGPAGACLAARVAGSGKSVLLVEARSFPRRKPCGGCLNARALGWLRAWGVESELRRAGAVALETFHLACGAQSARWSLPAGLAISRARLDSILVRRAIEAGAHFLPETTARVAALHDDWRCVNLNDTSSSMETRARLVAAADGLSHGSLKSVPCASSRVQRASRIGLQATLADDSRHFPPGELAMAVAKEGYVGLTRIEGGLLNVAAAIDPWLLRKHGEPADAVMRILRSCALPAPGGDSPDGWMGTPALTRRSRSVAGRRLFLIGDAAGYTEPFTGEGMALAMECAALATPLAIAACEQWTDALMAAWRRLHRTRIRQGQWKCRLLTSMLRSPGMTKMALSACRYWPTIPQWLIQRISQPPAGAARIWTQPQRASLSAG